jgi:hypothetical protein
MAEIVPQQSKLQSEINKQTNKRMYVIVWRCICVWRNEKGLNSVSSINNKIEIIFVIYNYVSNLSE